MKGLVTGLTVIGFPGATVARALSEGAMTFEKRRVEVTTNSWHIAFDGLTIEGN